MGRSLINLYGPLSPGAHENREKMHECHVDTFVPEKAFHWFFVFAAEQTTAVERCRGSVKGVSSPEVFLDENPYPIPTFSGTAHKDFLACDRLHPFLSQSFTERWAEEIWFSIIFRAKLYYPKVFRSKRGFKC
jgi:hypothetical protein